MSDAVPDIEIHTDLRAALGLYAEAAPDRPTVDPPGLAFALLSSAVQDPERGLLAKRLEKVGVSAASARDALLELLGGAERPTIPLSSSVAGVVGELRRQKAVSSWQFVRRLLRRHPHYGDGRGGEVARSAGPATAETRPVERWVDAIQARVKPGAAEFLNGRLVILGLARLAPSLGEYLEPTGLLESIREEIDKPVETVFAAGAGSGLETFGPLDSVRFHPDHPSADDQLGREGFARALAMRLGRIWNEYAQGGAPNSFMLQLHGPWGSGKTSLLAMLKTALQPSEGAATSGSRWVVVDFNAWLHQRLEAPWWQLLDAVYRQSWSQLRRIYRRPRKALLLWTTERWWRFFTLRRDLAFSIAAVVFLAVLVYLVFRMNPFGLLPDASKQAQQVGDVLALLGTLIAAGVVVGRSLVFGSVRSAQEFIESSADPMARISGHFHRLLRRIDRPVAIFIDDLDRCQEEYVIRLLEGIQTLFNDPRAVYVIAADRRWLHACYENAYARFQDRVHEPGRRLGTLFLEKVFQLSVAVPRLSPEIQEAYWRFLIRGRRADVESRLDAERAVALEEFAEAESESEVFSKLETSPEDPIRTQARREAAVERLATERVEETTMYFLEQFTHLLERNPRAMKRLLNAYTVHRDLAVLSGLNVLVDLSRREQLALWTILSLRWPLLRDYLVEQIEGRADPPEEGIRDLAASPEVRQVWTGEGIGASLDLETVQVLVGLGAREGESSGAVA
jgi:hypothetical protein